MYRIFLVEDDETIAKLVRRHLEKWDYDVHVVFCHPLLII